MKIFTNICEKPEKGAWQIKGVTIEKSTRKPSAENEKKAILKSIEKGYREVRAAQKKGEKLPDLDSLIES